MRAYLNKVNMAWTSNKMVELIKSAKSYVSLQNSEHVNTM